MMPWEYGELIVLMPKLGMKLVWLSVGSAGFTAELNACNDTGT